jgi:hypothetical protein
MKVVAATLCIKPRHSYHIKIHRLRFGTTIIAKWRAKAKKGKALATPHMEWQA